MIDPMLKQPKNWTVARLDPITDREPEMLANVSQDRLLGAVVQLMGEVAILRERLMTLEDELSSRRVVPKGAVENHVDTEPERNAKDAAIRAMVERFWWELAQSDKPISAIKPNTLDYR